MSEFNIYQSQAGEFRLASASPIYCVLNLAGEAGELCSLVAKGIRDGYKPDYEQNVKKELGDVLWMVAQVAADHGFTLQDVADSNILKLSKRKESGTIQGSGDNR